jgi:hypothetical protein
LSKKLAKYQKRASLKERRRKKEEERRAIYRK